MIMRWPPRKRLVWALAAVVLIVCIVTAAVWMVREKAPTATSRSDCDNVEKLGREWVAMVSSVSAAVETGPGERSDLLTLADRESAMSEKLRAAADSASTPAFKDHFNKWADGAVLSAQLERDAVDRPLQIEIPPDVQANQIKAAVMVDEASGALLEACPDVRHVLDIK